MTYEQIQTAAEAYAASIAQSDERKRYCAEDFHAGAKWRSDSAWHKAEENKVVLHKDVLAETKFGWKIGIFNAIGTFHEYVGLTTLNGEVYALYDIKRFAYIKDLVLDE